MKKNKGIAVTGMLYAVLILFLLLISGVLVLLADRKLVLDGIKKEVSSTLLGEIYSIKIDSDSILVSNNTTLPDFSYDLTDGVVVYDENGVVVDTEIEVRSNPLFDQSVNGVYEVTYRATVNNRLVMGRRTVEVVDPVVHNYSYSGAVDEFQVSNGGTYLLEAWGAQGGSYNTSYAAGGLGGYSSGKIKVPRDTRMYVYVGGQGSYGTNTTLTSTSNFSGGGFNGGGNASYRGGAGGGASDIRIDTDSLYARVLVAGGGGGAYAYSSTYKASGGAGGGTNGADGSVYSTTYTNFVGKGGSVSAGGVSNTAVTSGLYNGEAGSFGLGGAGSRAYSTSYYANGAGGGGWYGGSGADGYDGAAYTRASGGAGGSGFVFTSGTASSVPSNYLLSSSYYLIDASTVSGSNSFASPDGALETGHSGNGFVRITELVIDRYGSN